jgi:two-component system, OmpR family, response regulator
MGERRLWVIEDDVELAALTASFLATSGFEVTVLHDGRGAAARILSERPDVVLLDLGLGPVSGFDVCRRIRPAWRGVLIVITARREEIDEVLALELGADDVLTKPIRSRALLARIHGLLRRTTTDLHRIVVGPLQVDGRTRTAALDGIELELSTAEFDLLWFLAERHDEIVDRETLYRELRGIPWDGLDRSIDLRVSWLRKKLGDDGKRPALLRSVRGSGYLLAPL